MNSLDKTLARIAENTITNTADMAMTASQEEMVERLTSAIFKKVNRTSPNGADVKTFEISQLGCRGTISLLIEVGDRNDAGTMAEVFCRDRRHIFIGTRGGVQLANARDHRSSYKTRKNWPKGVWNAVHLVTR